MTANTTVPPPKLWSLKEALSVLGNVSRQTVSRAEKAGRIKLVRVGARVYVSDAELRRLAEVGLSGFAPTEATS